MTTPLAITREHAQRFLLRRHGLLGKTPFRGAEGVKQYIRLVGCVQYDPVDLCGKSHELSLFSHVEGFTREMLDELLYHERSLLDYVDKNMGIVSTEDWPRLGRIRDYWREHSRGREQVDAVAADVRALVHERGFASSQDLPQQGKIDWYWSPTSLSRAALETMYYRGELVVHHKTGAVKSYALAADCLPAALLSAPNPCAEKTEMQAWQALRRIHAVGLLPCGPSDAWLGVEDFKADSRNATFARLLSDGAIIPVAVEGIKKPLYMPSEELPLLSAYERPLTSQKHVRFLAPLDCMLWDRKVISALWGFDYTWEIYTPQSKMKYAHYVLPVVYGQSLCGRIQLTADRKAGVLIANRFWREDTFRGGTAFARAVEHEMRRLCTFLGLTDVRPVESFTLD